MSQTKTTQKPVTNAARLLRWFVLALVLIIIGTIATVLLQPRRSSPLALAQAAYLQGDYAGAVEAFSAAIAESPNAAEAYLGRGLAYVQLGEGEPARNDFLRAAELDASDSRSFYQLGLIALGMEQFPSAIDYFNQVIVLDADNTMAYASRAYAHTQSANYLLAIEDYNAAIALDNSVANFYLGLGDAHYALDNTAEALAAYEGYSALVETVDPSISQRILELRNR